MPRRSHVGSLVARLNEEIRGFPDDFYCSFNWTKTGRTKTHPWTLGVLAKILWELKGVTKVGIDERISLAGRRSRARIKFQPDLVAYHSETPIFFVDYESPNSSDTRVVEKDVDAFLAWRRSLRSQAEYVIITRLPGGPCKSWKARYGGRNRWLKKRHRAEIRKSPSASGIRTTARSCEANASMVNIDGKSASRMCVIGR
jgi:hypothetical protein